MALLQTFLEKKELKRSVIFGTCKNVYTHYANNVGLKVIFLVNVESGQEGTDRRDHGCEYDGVMLGE